MLRYHSKTMSGFFLFCSEFRPKIKSTNPGISIGDVAKKLGEMWNNLSDSEKQPYINKAAKLKEKYEKDVADYKSKGKFDGAKGPAKVARKKLLEWLQDWVKMAKGDPKKPKGKISAYAFFVQTCREEHKKKNPEVPLNFAEFSKKCSERWKTMSGKEKSKFDEMAKANKVRYDREMKDHGPAKGGKKKKDPNAPKRPPPHPESQVRALEV
ncbi:HMGB3 [Cervus elaphus hippelaphus]|uniref:High mobility group protein B3 n=1 Tax=Cervus elaphus hippelaphus TaxID=46360 RepID=A0A212C0H6_CEREH|nr:HMGB3 [Cervus elaphus hippelaphus]